MNHQAIGTIRSVNASLTIALLDASFAAAWEPADPAAAKKGELTGHPEQIMAGIRRGDAATRLDVGQGKGVAFDLEGGCGALDVYRVAEDKLVLVEPGHDWFADPDNHGDQADAIEALFSTILAGDVPEDAEELATLDVPSGTLAAMYMWHQDVRAAKTAAERLAPGLAAAVPDANGPTGLVAAMRPGTYRVLRASVDVGDLGAFAASIVPA